MNLQRRPHRRGVLECAITPEQRASEVQVTSTRSAEKGRTDIADRLLLLLAATGNLALLLWLLYFARYGIDFTDESFYLVWMADPFQYESSVSQFGFVYHPLYRWLDGDVAALRQFNFLVTFALAALMVDALLHAITPQDRAWDTLTRIAIATGLGSASLAVFMLWLPTPGYNSLNLQAMLITAMGLAWSVAPGHRRQLAGLVLVGAGGWLSFMAKPSTAALLGILALLFWTLSGRLTWRTALAPALSAGVLLLASALCIDGSVGTFIHRLELGLESGKLLGGGHGLDKLLRLDSFALNASEKTLFIALVSLPLVCTWLLQAERGPRRWAGGLLALGQLAALLAIVQGALPDVGLGQFQGMLFWAVPVTALLVAMPTWRSWTDHRPGMRVLLVITLLSMPYAFAFGTNGNYWWSAAFAAVFWTASAAAWVPTASGPKEAVRTFLPVVLVTQLVAALLLQHGMTQPYRQEQPLRQNGHTVEFGRPGATLKVSDAYAAYVETAVAVARGADFRPGTPVIDLSGQSPGILYAMQARNLGQAWMIGGYPGSHRLASFVLSSVPCETLAQAWILVEPGGPRSLPEALLTDFGADPTANYLEVGTWMTAPGAGGYNEPRRQRLLKPARAQAQAMAACESSREGASR